MSTSHKEKIIRVLQLFQTTDEKTPMNAVQISQKLEEEYGMENVHRTSIYDEPSNLIPAHLFKDGLRHIHPDPEQARTITVREAARLQTFPDNYYFNCSQTDAFKMIGNAVPPLFAKKVAYAIYHLIQEN